MCSLGRRWSYPPLPHPGLSKVCMHWMSLERENCHGLTSPVSSIVVVEFVEGGEWKRRGVEAVRSCRCGNCGPLLEHPRQHSAQLFLFFSAQSPPQAHPDQFRIAKPNLICHPPASAARHRPHFHPLESHRNPTAHPPVSHIGILTCHFTMDGDKSSGENLLGESLAQSSSHPWLALSFTPSAVCSARLAGFTLQPCPRALYLVHATRHLRASDPSVPPADSPQTKKTSSSPSSSPPSATWKSWPPTPSTAPPPPARPLTPAWPSRP